MHSTTIWPINDIQIKDRHRKTVKHVATLADSIATVGLLHPVVITQDGVLIAGERRLAACKHLGWVEVPVTIASNVTDIYTALRAERDENTCREPFAPSEAVLLARKIEPYEQEAARERQEESRNNRSENFTPRSDAEKGKSKDRTAAAVGMSRPTLTKAEQVVEAAEEAPELFNDLVEQMDTTNKVDRAYKELQQRRRQIEQERRFAEASQVLPSDRYRLIHAAVADLDLEEMAVDCIITDPPYPREYLPVYAELARLAAVVLKPGGSLFVMVGQSYLPDVIAAITPHLQYHWTLAYLTPGGQAVQIFPRNVNTFWKPVLWFVNGQYRGPWLGDVTRSAANDNDKRFHDWGQSESGMADLLERCSQPNDLVLDPFCGGGTTGVVSLQLGRRFIGADNSTEALHKTKLRLAEVCRD